MKEIGLLPHSCWLGLPIPQSLLTTGPEQDRCSVCILPAFSAFIFLPGDPDYCSVGLIVNKFLPARYSDLEARTFSPHWPIGASVTSKKIPAPLCKTVVCFLEATSGSSMFCGEAYNVLHWAISFFQKACAIASVHGKIIGVCKKIKKKRIDSSSGAIREDRGGRVSCDVTVNQHFPFHLLAPMQHINIQGPGGEQPEGQRSRGERSDRQRTRCPEGTLR